jgi:hypothetical protein
MAEVKNSNYMGLGNIVNPLNMKGEIMNELDDLNGSIVAPSDYSDIQEELFGNSESASDSGSVSIETKDDYVADGSEDNSDEESDDNSDPGSDEESDSSEVIFNDPTKGVKGVVNLDDKPVKGGLSKPHLEILNDIETKKADLLKYGLPVPHYKPSKIKRDHRQASEVLKIMTDLIDDNKGADSLMSLLNFALKVLCAIFNGRHELAGYKLDLSGYNVTVISDLKEMRDDTVQFTKYVRSKVGKDAMKVLQLIKIFIINAGVTIWNNNSGANSMEAFGDELEDDEYDEDGEEEE